MKDRPPSLKKKDKKEQAHVLKRGKRQRNGKREAKI